MTNDELRGLFANASASGLRDWLEKRRWFADKGRGIADLAVDDLLLSAVGEDQLALAIARVTCSDGAVCPSTVAENVTGPVFSAVNASS